MLAPDKRKHSRVAFEKGFPTWIMAIDGTWRIECIMIDASASGARLRLASPPRVDKEFFLLLSATGLAYRRCELAWISGDEIGVQFKKTKSF